MRQVRLVLLVDNGGILEVTICVTCDSDATGFFLFVLQSHDTKRGPACGAVMRLNIISARADANICFRMDKPPHSL